MGVLKVTRREGESIRIGPDVTVTVLRISNYVRLLVNAPPMTPIRRSEIAARPANVVRPHAARGNLGLGRREGESIQIGADVRVTVERIGAVRISLSIEAPDEMVVMRTEIINRPANETSPPQKATA